MLTDRQLIALNLLKGTIDSQMRNQLAAEALREKWIQKKLDQANVNGAAQ